jgi:hypothetical protein
MQREILETLDGLSVKYFKLVVDTKSIKKDTPQEVQANCPVCNDRKHRLHLYRPDGFTQDVVHCFNEGCELQEKHHNMINFLKIARPDLLNSYKRENTKKIISQFQTESPQSVLETIEKTVDKSGDIEIPLDRFFIKCKDSDVCKSYVKHRGFTPKDDWYFSDTEFFKYNDKNVYLKNYLIIPIYNNNKYKGFYSRSITEKKFSTFLLPGVEKVWTSKPDLVPEEIQILTEGVFDALSSGFEKSAAMLSASVSKNFMNKLDKNCIIALDNDCTGIKKSIQFAQQGFKVFIPPDNWNYKDFNDALIDGVPKTGIRKIIEDNSYSGVLAVAKLKMKEI